MIPFAGPPPFVYAAMIVGFLWLAWILYRTGGWRLR